MAKKKKNLSEIKNTSFKKRPVNPFEVHVNRQKFNVLGREMKTDRGLPGVARAKALKKRKETLLHDYKIQNKSNKFFDRRIGERNSAMTKEDRIIARFNAERMKSLKKKNIFNLADDEILTHKGQSIADIEKFDDPLSDDDDGEIKGLNANFVEEANFGGGLLSESKNNRATVIEQLIAESKKRKVERQLAKERTLQKTEELDAEWKDLIPIVSMGQGPLDVEKKDAYDIILNDLKFEPRGTPSNKLKSETEIAEEEAHKLKELEEERLRRMRGDDPTSKPKILHRSADDLDDGFEIEDDYFELKYDKDGNPIGLDKLNEEKVDVEKEETSEEESGDEESEEEDEEESANEDNNDEINTKDGLSDDDSENKGTGDTDKNTVPEETNNQSSDDDSDDLSDLQVQDDEEKPIETDSEGEEIIDKPNITEEKLCNLKKNNEHLHSLVQEQEEHVNKDVVMEGDKNKLKVIIKEVNENKIEGKTKEKKRVSFNQEVKLVTYGQLDLLKQTDEDIAKAKEEREKQMEKARKELPYTFKVPETYEEFQELLKERSVQEQAVIIERMIKCTHPSLNEKNKEKLENLFAFLMQHLNDANNIEAWSTLDHLAPFLFELTQFSPINAAYCLNEVIFEKHSDYQKKKNKYPTPETLLFLKLVPLLFPTSDKRHVVTTPAFAFISGMLSQCQVTTRRAIATGLFLVSLVTEYIGLSKRVMPEALNFLCGIIHMASPVSDVFLVPPFKKEHKFLFLHESYANRKDLTLNMQGSDLSQKAPKIDDIFRIRSIYCTLKLLETLARNYEGIPGCRLLFEPIMKHLHILEMTKYPEAVREAYSQLIDVINGIFGLKMNAIVMEAKKPKALRLYEPSIQPVYEYKKTKLSGSQAEHAKLLYKYKKEMKGAVREIRRDRQFITKLKFKEQSTSDAERKRKVKEIYAWGAQQESEYKKLKRKKN